MPQLRDPNFVRSVVLLCEHGAQGALGFVVNRPTEVRAVDAVVLDPPASGDSGLMLWAGGPVESQRGFLLLGDDPGVEDSERVAEGFHLTASVDVLRRLLTAAPADTALRRARLLLGYAGWGPGQLESELDQNAWFVVDLHNDDPFASDPDRLWRSVLRRQRGEIAFFAHYPEDVTSN